MSEDTSKLIKPTGRTTYVIVKYFTMTGRTAPICTVESEKRADELIDALNAGVVDGPHGNWYDWYKVDVSE